jgi:hypothetical protein
MCSVLLNCCLRASLRVVVRCNKLPKIVDGVEWVTMEDDIMTARVPRPCVLEIHVKSFENVRTTSTGIFYCV